eukprot:1734395-Rhodomonas_salina.1
MRGGRSGGVGSVISLRPLGNRPVRLTYCPSLAAVRPCAGGVRAGVHCEHACVYAVSYTHLTLPTICSV